MIALENATASAVRKGKPVAALVARDGIVAFWSDTIGRHGTVPA